MDPLNLLAVILALATHVPFLVVLVVGAILALANRARHPQVSRLVVAYAVFEIVLIVASTALFTLLPGWLGTQGRSGAEIGRLYGIIGMVVSSLHALAQILILYAALGWRRERTAET